MNSYLFSEGNINASRYSVQNVRPGRGIVDTLGIMYGVKWMKEITQIVGKI